MENPNPRPPPSPASERATRSFFTELHGDPGAIRVCQGASCFLAGAPRPTEPWRGVYCLGCCDRSPAMLLPDGSLISGPPPVEPSIRCSAREAIVTERIARGDFSDIGEARKAGVYLALRSALEAGPEAVLLEVEASGERGRGGAGFPIGRKWRICAELGPGPRVAIANGDEGDPGSFIDRVLLERDPHAVIEGLILCGFAIGASRGILYVRAEYPGALEKVQAAVAQARQAGILGASVLGSDFGFEVEVHAGQGSYVCGEETALLNALEGERGEVRLRPPYPVEQGLFAQPTVVNNIESLVNVPWLVRRGAAAFRSLGTAASSGTKALCLNAGFARPGIVEVELGTSLAHVIEQEAGGSADGTELEAVAVGGPMGSVLLPDEWQVSLCYDVLHERGIQLGHGGIVALPRGTDFQALLEHWLRFMRDESCGKCVPCRAGSARALELAATRSGDLARLERLLELMSATSLCAFGQLLPEPVRKILRNFGDRLGDGSAT